MRILRRSIGRLAPLALLCGAACGRPNGRDQDSGKVVRAWAHAGQEAERRVIQEQVDRFNRVHPRLSVELTLLPEGSYNEQVQAAALAGDLPDVLELDGPFVAAYAWQGHLRPVDSLIPDSVQAALLPSIREQGTYRGRLWALGTYDSGLGLFARRSALEEVGARIPERPQDAWTLPEMEGWLAALADLDDDGAVLDLHLNYPGEWYTYAIAPALYSAGGGLMDSDGMRATGTLDAPATARALARIQGWITRGWVEPNLDDAAFTEGRVALSWSGHWDFRRYEAAWPDDVVVLPLPDFGEGTRTGQGSWVWAVTGEAEAAEDAATWVRFLLSPDEVQAMTMANAAVPALQSVADASALYGPSGPLRLLLAQLSGQWAVPRPRTPAYPIVTSAFQEAFEAVRNGEDVQEALEAAARLIDREVADNDGYPPTPDAP